MPHDPHLLATAAWLIEMADNPLTSGSKGHAAHRLAELQASHSMYRVLPELIAQLRASTSGRPSPAEGLTDAAR